MTVYKTNWASTDYINFGDWNRIESNIQELSDYLNTIEYPMPPLRVNSSALSFDGVDDYVDFGSPSSLNITGDLTLEAWVNATGTDSAILTWANDPYTTFPYHWNIYVGTGTSRVNLGITYDSDSAVPLDKWVHLAVTISGTTLTFYLNGQVDGVRTITNTRVQGDSTFSLSRKTMQFFKGKMDEVRIWNVTRSQSEIQANMRKVLGGTEGGLVGYWRCDDGTGTTLTATKGVNGTLMAGTTWTTNVPYIGAINNRTASSIDFLSSINRIENNLDAIKTSFGMTPPNYLTKKTWSVGQGFSFEDVNRLENNTQIIKTYGELITKSYRYCGAFTCGDQGGLF
jgi:hypothetical protein